LVDKASSWFDEKSDVYYATLKRGEFDKFLTFADEKFSEPQALSTLLTKLVSRKYTHLPGGDSLTQYRRETEHLVKLLGTDQKSIVEKLLAYVLISNFPADVREKLAVVNHDLDRDKIWSLLDRIYAEADGRNRGLTAADQTPLAVAGVHQSNNSSSHSAFQSQYQQQPWCKYCKKLGHRIEDCRKRLFRSDQSATHSSDSKPYYKGSSSVD
jgi:hypothetical protein